jgi:hypothetical protein
VERKIADLEITNKSLLAINSGLEVTKHRQGRELRDLKRRLREGRGMTLGPSEIAAGAAAALSPGRGYRNPDEEDDDYFGEEDDEEEEQAKEDPELEAAHIRCRDLIDAMLNAAREAILSRYVPEEKKSKVLTAGEVQERDLDLEGSAGGHGSHAGVETVDTSASWQADTSLASSVADLTASAVTEETDDGATVVIPEAELPKDAPPGAGVIDGAEADAGQDISLDTSTATSTTKSTADADDSNASEERDEEGEEEEEEQDDDDDEGESEDEEDEDLEGGSLHPHQTSWTGNTGAADVSID